MLLARLGLILMVHLQKAALAWAVAAKAVAVVADVAEAGVDPVAVANPAAAVLASLVVVVGVAVAVAVRNLPANPKHLKKRDKITSLG